MRVANKIALGTGGGSGLGEACCRRLAEEGATLVVTDIRAEEAQRVAEDINRQGGSAMAYEQDVTQEAAWESVCKAIASQHGVLDILVNNAGVIGASPIEDTATEAPAEPGCGGCSANALGGAALGWFSLLLPLLVNTRRPLRSKVLVLGACGVCQSLCCQVPKNISIISTRACRRCYSRKDGSVPNVLQRRGRLPEPDRRAGDWLAGGGCVY